jgi:hypothetical protein
MPDNVAIAVIASLQLLLNLMLWAVITANHKKAMDSIKWLTNYINRVTRKLNDTIDYTGLIGDVVAELAATTPDAKEEKTNG